ncbi:MAG: type II/IV secretion system protein, partial [Verrucomicrobiia bacterium]
MDLLAADSLPESLIGSLEEEQQQLVFEAARHERIATLATVLEQPEQDVLTAIANHAGLDIASDLRADDSSLRLLPARLVHEYQILPIALGEPAPATEDEDEDEPVEPGADTPLHLATAWLPDDVMSDWIHTFTPRPVVWHLAVAERVHQLIVEHFGVGAASLDDGDDDYLSPEAAEADADIV